MSPRGLDPRALRRIKILANMTDDQLDRFAQFVEVEKVPQWSVIVKQGDPGNSMYFILDGELRVRIDVMGKETILATLAAGDFFGDVSLFDHGPRSADVVANTDSTVVRVSAAGFDALAKEAPEIATPFLRAVGRTLSARIRTDNKRFGDSVKFARAAEVVALPVRWVRPSPARRSVPQQPLQGVPCFRLARSVFPGRDELAPNEVEVFAIVGKVLLPHQVGAALAALLSDPRVVVEAIQTHL